MKRGIRRLSWTPAYWAGLAALAAAPLLGLARPEWAVAPLAFFVCLCAVLPFFPRSRFFLPVLSRGRTGQPVVAVTFDDGPDPATTPPLLDLLARHAVRAAFFVTGVQAARNPDLIQAILARGHEMGNHSCHHDPLLMLRSTVTLHGEIASAQRILRDLGIEPLCFRPPVGITNSRLEGVLQDLNLLCVTFSCRGGDWGNRRLAGLAQRILQKVRRDDIILLHDVQSGADMDVARWLGEVDGVLAGIRQRGLRAVPLSELLGRPVMKSSLTKP